MSGVGLRVNFERGMFKGGGIFVSVGTSERSDPM